MKILDRYGRRISYLRLSLTDRCNLRCHYCMPADGIEKLHHNEILSLEELHMVAEEAVLLGIDKIRLTGGEPLLRKGLIPFCERLASLRGLKELVLTTNGTLLPEMAAPLRKAGVKRLNISLDSLKAERFSAITRGGDLWRVLAGIKAAMAAGFPPPKINMVMMAGINDDEVLDFARLTVEHSFTVRFIEYMPTLKEVDWQKRCIPGTELLERIGRAYRLIPLVSTESAGPAKNFKIEGGAGSIGIITPISGHFCDSCNRIRVSSRGMAHGCLFSGGSIDLKPALRSGKDGYLRRSLLEIVSGKPMGHRLREEHDDRSPFAMSGIGG